MTHTTRILRGLTRRAFAGGLAGAATLAAPALRAQTTSRIVLGQSAAFTGAAAQLGIQFHAGAQLFFEQYNATGSGRPRVDIVQLDDGYEPDRCAENTRKLLDQDVFALFGYIGTPTSVVALPLATKAEVPFIAPFTGAMALRQPFNRMAFHLRASYNDETELIVKNLVNLGLTRVAVFHQNDAYGKAGLDGTTLALAARGLKPVATGTVERNTVDVAAAVASINAANPQAVVQISAYKSCAAYIRAARKAGYGGSFYNVSFVGTQALADELGKDGAGVVVSQVVPAGKVQNALQRLGAGLFAQLLAVRVPHQRGVQVAGCGRPSARCSRIWRGVLSARSSPRTTWVMPWCASSTTTASW
jgi:branched-chain amino acid transport system substrate-binding protein